MRAIILADVPASGLEPFSFAAPPAMLPVAGLTVADRLAERFREAGFAEIVTVSSRKLALSTPGSLVLEASLRSGEVIRAVHQRISLHETFLLAQADSLGDLNLSAALSLHRSSSSLVTAVVDPSRRQSRYGGVEQDVLGRVEHLHQTLASQSALTGVYICEPEVIGRLSERQDFDFEQDLLVRLVSTGRVSGHPCSGSWHWLTTVAEFHDAWLSHSSPASGTCVHPDASVESCWIGSDCQIEAGVTLSGCVIDDSTHIHSGFSARDSFLRGNQIIDRCGEVTIADPDQLSWMRPMAQTEADVSQDLLRLASRVDKETGPMVEYHLPELEKPAS